MNASTASPSASAKDEIAVERDTLSKGDAFLSAVSAACCDP